MGGGQKTTRGPRGAGRGAAADRDLGKGCRGSGTGEEREGVGRSEAASGRMEGRCGALPQAGNLCGGLTSPA